MEVKKFKQKREHPLIKFECVKTWLAGLEQQTRYGYLSTLKKFCKFVKKNPDEILTERGADKEFKYENKTLEFFLAQKSASSGKVHVARLQSFFDFHRRPLKFTREQAKRISKSAAPVYIDYILTRDDLIKMYEVADVRDRAILLTMASAPLSEDLCTLTRAQFEQARKGHLERIDKGELMKDDPMCIAPRGGFIYRGKTKVKMRPFLTSDAVHAIDIYLKTRKDSELWLFVNQYKRQLTEPDLNEIVQRLSKKAILLIPDGQRVRAHAFRKMFKDVASDCDIARDWVCILYGHKIEGSENFYTVASEDKLREKFKRMVPHISISRAQNMVIMRNQFGAALDDTVLEILNVLKEMNPDKLQRVAGYTQAMKPMIIWNPEKEFEPALYRIQRALRKIQGKGE